MVDALLKYTLTSNSIIPTRYKVSKWLWCFWFLTIKLPFTSSTKFIFLQTSLGVRGQLEHPPLSYKRSLIVTPAGDNQRRKKVMTFKLQYYSIAGLPFSVLCQAGRFFVMQVNKEIRVKLEEQRKRKGSH